MTKNFRFLLPAAAGVASLLVLSGCAVTETSGAQPTSSSTDSASMKTASLDQTQVHEIAITVDETALTEMIQTYLDTGEKEWVSASVTIDGETFDNVGIKLKGNSSLRRITVDTPAQDLPLRIRLDKYVDGQEFAGISDFTIRSNSSETSMNEAVALDLLSEAGLASTLAIATRVSVNGSEEALTLTVQNLDDTWVDDYFPDAGGDSVLYKAEADGEWSWQGEDADYSASFDIEAGADDHQPLIDLLDLVNNGSAEEIAAELPGMLDIDSFATYLAFEEVIDNFDDIDGPGNNAYLFWDSSTGRFTVVAWDHNLAFGGSPTGGGPGGQRPDGEQGERIGDPDQAPPFGGGAGAQNAGGPGGMTRDNPLVSAFTANSEWLALYESRVTELESSLIDSGTLEASVDEWENTLTAGASDLVADETITTEGDAILASAATAD